MLKRKEIQPGDKIRFNAKLYFYPGMGMPKEPMDTVDGSGDPGSIAGATAPSLSFGPNDVATVVRKVKSNKNGYKTIILRSESGQEAEFFWAYVYNNAKVIT